MANPEIDQLSGQFSNRRGRVGILTCRELEDNFIKRCADTYEDERGLVIPLEDKDLKEALMNYPQHGVEAIEEIISKKFEQIVFYQIKSLVVTFSLLLLILLVTGSSNLLNLALICHNL